MDIDVGSPPASDLRYYDPFSPNLKHEEKQRKFLEVALNVLVLSNTRLELWILIKANYNLFCKSKKHIGTNYRQVLILHIKQTPTNSTAIFSTRRKGVKLWEDESKIVWSIL
jgi:hypothetical protein